MPHLDAHEMSALKPHFNTQWGGRGLKLNKRTVLFIWKSGDRSEDKSRTSDFRIETSPMSPVTIKTLVAVKKKT